MQLNGCVSTVCGSGRVLYVTNTHPLSQVVLTRMRFLSQVRNSYRI